MRSLAGCCFPGTSLHHGRQRMAQRWQLDVPATLHCRIYERERRQVISGRNDVACDERRARTKRISRTLVGEDEWKHNKDTK